MQKRYNADMKTTPHRQLHEVGGLLRFGREGVPVFRSFVNSDLSASELISYESGFCV